MTGALQDAAAGNACAGHNHWVVFYRDELSLRGNVAAYVASALRSGRPALVIARPAVVEDVRLEMHRQHVQGIPFGSGRGELVVADAAETLARFCPDGEPDHGKFVEVVGKMIDALSSSGKPVAAYGEMVALLCSRGHYDGAVKLEAYWNELLAGRKASLYCAYGTPLFGTAKGKSFLGRLRDAHSISYEQQGPSGMPQWPHAEQSLATAG
jgi:hypothetical protein